jgi:hypothetical protein
VKKHRRYKAILYKEIYVTLLYVCIYENAKYLAPQDCLRNFADVGKGHFTDRLWVNVPARNF